MARPNLSGIHVHIEIEDFEELNSAKHVAINVPATTTVKALLQKIAKKGNVYLISTDVSFGINNFDLVRELPTSSSILDKLRTLKDLGFKEQDRIELKLRKKKRHSINIRVNIENYEKLQSARLVGFRFLEDNLVSEAIHIIATKEGVKIPVEDERNYALYHDKILLDFNKSLGSFNFDDNVELTLRRDNDRHFGVLIENYTELNCVRYTTGKLPLDTTIGDALVKIATKGAVGIPRDQVENYEFFNPDTNSPIKKQSTLSGIKNGDILILRKLASDDFYHNIVLEECENMEKIGAGTFGKVYKAIYRGREIAIKQLKEKPEDKLIEEFNKEVEMLKKTSGKCPQIVTLLGTIEDPKRMSIVMEYCALGSLFHVMQSPTNSMGWDRVFHCAIETVKGINFLHSQNILHRDIKSLNILVTQSWCIKLCDFGVARLNNLNNLVTLRRMKTTPAWSAPELLKELPFSEKSDIYSFGIVLWELTNRCIKGYYQRPFSEFPGIHVDFQILVQASSKNLRPTLSKNTPLNKLYQSCVVAEPDDRPKGSEVLENLIKFERDFQTNPHSWNSLINTQSNTKA